MLVQCCTSLNSCALSSQRAFLSHNHNLGRFRNHPSRRTCKFTCLLHVGFEDIAQVVHNKVGKYFDSPFFSKLDLRILFQQFQCILFFTLQWTCNFFFFFFFLVFSLLGMQSIAMTLCIMYYYSIKKKKIEGVDSSRGVSGNRAAFKASHRLSSLW